MTRLQISRAIPDVSEYSEPSVPWASHLPEPGDSPPFFDELPKLFTSNSATSWVDFHATRRQSLPGSPIVYVDLKTEEYGNSTHHMEGEGRRIESWEEMWQLADSRSESSCHVFFIRQKNSNSPLLVSRRLFEALIRSNKVFEQIKEFAMSFGWKQRELDIGPPHCRFEMRDSKDRKDQSNLNVFGNFECAYCLRYVELNKYGGKKEPWSIRQTAVYQRYDQRMQTWIFISPSKQVESKVEKHIQQLSTSNSSSTSKNPFELHLDLITASLVNWRWYIKSLVDRATQQSIRVIAAEAGKGKLSALIDFDINFEDRQILKVVEDKALDLFTIFESTSDTISTILQEYQSIHNENMGLKPDRIIKRLLANLREVELYRKKAETLYKMVQGTASLLSDLLDYENAKIAEENSRALAVLAQESREENIAMRMLTEKGTNDAAAVKVITLITILFLPTTVVAGFFSTQFVKQSEDGRNLVFTDNWWLIVAISAPLTIFIIAVWYCWITFPWQRWWDEWRQRHFTNPVQQTEVKMPKPEPCFSMRKVSDLESRLSLGERADGVQPTWRNSFDTRHLVE